MFLWAVSFKLMKDLFICNLNTICESSEVSRRRPLRDSRRVSMTLTFVPVDTVRVCRRSVPVREWLKSMISKPFFGDEGSVAER